MWFKNLNIYKVENFEQVHMDNLALRLEEDVFTPCEPHDAQKAGWIPPMGENFEQFIHTTNGSHMICLKSQEKKVPSSFVNEKIKEKENERRSENSEFIKFSKDEKEELKDQIIYDNLPHAFPSSSEMTAYIDTQLNYLVINSSSRNKAEGLILFLRGMIEDSSIIFTPLQTVHEPANTMSNWLIDGKAVANLVFGEKCKLKDMSSTGSITYTKHDMEDDQLIDYLNGDKTVSELAFCWDDKIDFTLTDDFLFKGVKFLDIYKQEVKDTNSEGYPEIFDAEFDTMINAIREFIPFSVESLGGENEDN
jgi:recombination associated protein RdgC